MEVQIIALSTHRNVCNKLSENARDLKISLFLLLLFTAVIPLINCTH